MFQPQTAHKGEVGSLRDPRSWSRLCLAFEGSPYGPPKWPLELKVPVSAWLPRLVCCADAPLWPHRGAHPSLSSRPCSLVRSYI